MQSEAEYVKKGHYVFYHAQIWEIFLRESVYTTLSNIKHAQQAEHYFFTRFPFDGTCSENAALIKKERRIRKGLMLGRYETHMPVLLFLNYALFGNTTNGGSSSFHYFVYNSNVTNPGISSRDVFAQFGLEAFYDNNKDEIQLLEKKFLQLTRHGNLLQIAISKEHLKKHLYLTTAGGPKIKAQILKDVFNYAYNKDGEIVDVIENRVVDTDDVVELIETLKHNPENIDNSDQKEFVWIVTADTIHKAKKDGVEIKSFNTADQEKLTQVTNKFTNLLTTKLAGHWKKPEMTPWECYKKYKHSSVINEFNESKEY